MTGYLGTDRAAPVAAIEDRRYRCPKCGDVLLTFNSTEARDAAVGALTMINHRCGR